MFESWQLVLLSLAYTGLLFFIANLGTRQFANKIPGGHALIYSLTLGVYCTSWSFLGTTGQAASNMLSYLPIYLGPILLFIFAWPFLQRLVRVSLKLNLTSIADLLAARFGKSHKLAMLVTFVALVGVLPYIALQLKAIVYSFQLLSIESSLESWQLALLVTILLTIFTIIFGIRTIDVTERHPGVMLAVAFESLIKVIAFLAVGLFVCFSVFESPMEIWWATKANLALETELSLPNIGSMLGLLIIVMAAFLCLPRQFQVMIVELKNESQMPLSRIVFPLYLLVFAVFSMPLGLAGHHLLSDTVPPDAYVLFLPAAHGQMWLTLFAFIGAVSAASAMVIISSIALSTMLSNEIVFPKLFRKNQSEIKDFHHFKAFLLTIRKVLVAVVIALGYCVYLVAPADTLSSLGEISFGAIAQLAPALIAAFYWRKATLTGVYSGIAIGFILWLSLNLLPEFGFYPHPVSFSALPITTTATLLSLAANILAIRWFSQVSRQSVQEKMQARLFLPYKAPTKSKAANTRTVNLAELQTLAAHFVGHEKAMESFTQLLARHKTSSDQQAFNQKLMQHTEGLLAGVMGASSARLVMSSALEGRELAFDDLAFLVEQTSTERKKFGHDLLQSAIENAGEGISIIDNELKLVAWNQRYLDLFKYPDSLIYVGAPIESLIRHNVERGLCGPGDVEQQVQKRIDHLKVGNSHSSERENAQGQVIRIQGNPLPGGGFVMVFSDITPYRQAERILTEKNLDLASLVDERNKSLEAANRELDKAHQAAKLANEKKSQYLKACSHDLMQPLEAARLFTSALAHNQKLDEQQQRQVQNIDHALKTANHLLSDLTEVARIESGNIHPKLSAFSLGELLQSIADEFSLLSKDSQITFHACVGSYWVYSDKRLLRRIIQNLLGNAFRYAAPGRVLLGCRRRGQQVEIQVLDNGPGIDKAKHLEIFEQFTQLDKDNRGAKGLGLGLNIARSLSQLLEHQLGLKSEPNRGSLFYVQVPIAKPQLAPKVVTPAALNSLAGVNVLCVDNEPDVLAGMIELLSAWQCNIFSATSFSEAEQIFAEEGENIEIMLVDYQLGNGDDGITLMNLLSSQLSHSLPGILITATTDVDVEEMAKQAGYGYLRKLVKPAALRAMMSAMLAKQLQGNFRS